MTRRSFPVGVILACVVVAVCTAPAQAQFAGGANDPSNVAGFTAGENTGTVGARAPGNLVAASITRTLRHIASPRLGFRVTDTRSLNPRQIFLIDAINIVFRQVNTALTLFESVLLARSGGTPSLSNLTDLAGGSNTSSSGGGTTPVRGDLNRPR